MPLAKNKQKQSVSLQVMKTKRGKVCRDVEKIVCASLNYLTTLLSSSTYNPYQVSKKHDLNIHNHSFLNFLK